MHDLLNHAPSNPELKRDVTKESEVGFWPTNSSTFLH